MPSHRSKKNNAGRCFGLTPSAIENLRRILRAENQQWPNHEQLRCVTNDIDLLIMILLHMHHPALNQPRYVSQPEETRKPRCASLASTIGHAEKVDHLKEVDHLKYPFLRVRSATVPVLCRNQCQSEEASCSMSS